MGARRLVLGLMFAIAFVVSLTGAPPQAPPTQTPSARPAPANPKLEALKQEALAEVEARKGLTQQMVDMVFSFGELGFQEFETAKYLTGILKNEGFAVEENVAGIPTAWVATWGTKDVKYEPLIGPDDKPAVWMNKETMDRFRPEMRKFYYDPTKYASYLAQLGITYPTIRSKGSPDQEE